MARVLVVDDEDAFTHFLPLALERDGHHVRTAATGREAISIALEYQPRLLIVDWMLMDSLTGIDVARHLKRDLKELSTILITGHPLRALGGDGDDAINAILRKPFDLHALRQLVGELTSEASAPKS